MIKVLSFLLLLAFSPVCWGTSAMAQDDAKILGLLKSAKYKEDFGIKVVEANFKKTGSDEFWDKWESNLKIKNCYSTKMQCSGDGRWQITDEEINYSVASNPFWPVIPSLIIEKWETKEVVGIIGVYKKYFDLLSFFNIKVGCGPLYHEHPNKYPPNHNYWKQFIPKNKCN